MKEEWVIYPEKEYLGEGNVVAAKYMCGFCKTRICTIYSYSRYYRVESNYIDGSDYYIKYDNVELRRLKKKLNRKSKKGYITGNQYDKIVLMALCEMVDRSRMFYFMSLNK